MAEESDKKEIETVPGKPAEDWMARKWRPMMGWTYMATCVFDFVIAPIAWSMLQALLKQPVTQWMPVTLQCAGLYDVAMGAVLGVAAWSRGQEKMAGVVSPPSTGPQYQPRIAPRFEPGISTTQGFNGTSMERSYTSVRPAPPPAQQPEL